MILLLKTLLRIYLRPWKRVCQPCSHLQKTFYKRLFRKLVKRVIETFHNSRSLTQDIAKDYREPTEDLDSIEERPEFVDILIFPFYNCKSCPQSKVNLSKGFYTPVHILKIHLQIKKKTLPWSFGLLKYQQESTSVLVKEK